MIHIHMGKEYEEITGDGETDEEERVSKGHSPTSDSSSSETRNRKRELHLRY